MLRSKKKLSVLEWELMEFVWQHNKAISVREVLDLAYPNGEKAYTTIQTVMNKLVEKGFAQKEKIGLVNFYSPVKARTESLTQEISGFLNRTFGGSVNALVNFMLEGDTLSPTELAELKKLIQEKEKQRGKND